MGPGLIANKEYDFIRKLVYDRSRINLGPDKQELVRSRLQKRLRALNLSSLDDYCRLLNGKDGDAEVTALLDAISTNFTNFFREWKHFEFLQNTLLPQWEGTSPGGPSEALRIWSAACSSGEEPYSLAILLADHFRRRAQPQRQAWQIFATDISTRMLSTANQAIYSEEKVKFPDPSWLRNYFQKGVGKWDGSYRVKSELREHITFERLNLIESPYPFSGAFNAIFCRNVMIYFDNPTQRQLIPQLIQHLAPKGYLFVGHSESLLGIEHGLKCVQPSIYQRV
ncbi:MAG: protein-glutamate O-methyltransferase CheR [Opitutaceae bacterium]|jgi:chemotaxis protein methyltransferase CheR